MQIKRKIRSKLQLCWILSLLKYLFTRRKSGLYIYIYIYIYIHIPFVWRVGTFAVGISPCRQMAPWNEASVGALCYDGSFWNTDSCDTQNTQYLILRYRVNFEYAVQTPHTCFIAAATSKSLFPWSLQLIFQITLDRFPLCLTPNFNSPSKQAN